MTAIIAGGGRLPALLAHALEASQRPFLVSALEGIEVAVPHPVERFRLERLVPFLDALVDRGVTQVAFGGEVQRPRLDPEVFDPRTAMLAPRIAMAMCAGDDAMFCELIAVCEEHGLSVAGAAEIAPELLPGAGVLGRIAPTPSDMADATRAAGIVGALGSVDVGQGAVVAQGLCLAVEALPGTDPMLAQLAAAGDLRPDPAGPRGLLYKAPKPGQELRIDMPAIGPGTLRAAAAAGLGGVAFQAGGVLLFDREEAVAEADALGLFLWGRACDSS